MTGSLEDKISKEGVGAARLDDEASKYYFMGRWDMVGGMTYKFIDGISPGAMLTAQISPGHKITIHDIEIEPGLHRVEMLINQGGKTYHYATQMHEHVLDLFGSFGDHIVNLDEQRPNLEIPEIRAIQAIPYEVVRNILLCTITRPLPEFSFEDKNPDYKL